MMDLSTAEFALACCMFLGATLYTAVGHAGASAYLALMALFAMPAATMRPTALVLNVLVASFTTFRYMRAGLFDWRTLWPFLLGAIPLGFIGGALQLSSNIYRPIVGVMLLLAAVRLLLPSAIAVAPNIQKPPVLAGVVAGAGVGLLSGLTGTGGGIFLSPILLFFGWAQVKVTSGVVAFFILFVSLAGLSGNLSSVRSLPPQIGAYGFAVLLGAVVGTTLGTRRLASDSLLKVLGLVLIIAGLKLIGARYA